MTKNRVKILLIAGARPNFMKIAPLLKELKKSNQFQPLVVHTGQHYDKYMSALFFEQLQIPTPDINLEVGSASHAEQTALIMKRFEQVCLQQKPDAVLVVGDVNSTPACTLVAAKLNITTIHYEAGLRSRDRTMPEEINRLVTDAICDFFFTTSKDADENLFNEGHSPESIFMCGNLMIDSLQNNLKKTVDMPLVVKTLNPAQIQMGKDFYPHQYGVLTLHRPANVDHKNQFEQILHSWQQASQKIPLIFPIHPRTWKNIERFGLEKKVKQIKHLFLSQPLGYLQFIKLVKDSLFVLTDSGGIQEETTFLRIPCLTLRSSTERPVTIWQGSNKLIKTGEILTEIDLIMKGQGKKGKIPKYWDGRTATRIVQILKQKWLKSRKKNKYS